MTALADHRPLPRPLRVAPVREGIRVIDTVSAAALFVRKRGGNSDAHWLFAIAALERAAADPASDELLTRATEALEEALRIDAESPAST